MIAASFALRAESGALHYEHCLTRQGFEGAYSILYHRSLPPRDVGRAAAGVASITPRRVRTRCRLVAETGWPTEAA